MTTATIQTITTMLERLPEHLQQQTYEHLTEYLEELEDEAKWDAQFAKSQDKLMGMAKQVKAHIKAGQAKPMDYDAL